MNNYLQNRSTGSNLENDKLLSVDCCKCKSQIKSKFWHMVVIRDNLKYQLLLCEKCYIILENKQNKEVSSFSQEFQNWLDQNQIQDYQNGKLIEQLSSAEMKGEISYCDQCKTSESQTQQFYDHLKRYANRVDDINVYECEIQRIYLAKLIAEDQIHRDKEIIDNLDIIIKDQMTSQEDKLFAIFRKKEIIQKYQ